MGDYDWQSYEEVSARADQLAKGLLELGLRPQDKVCIIDVYF